MSKIKAIQRLSQNMQALSLNIARVKREEPIQVQATLRTNKLISMKT